MEKNRNSIQLISFTEFFVRCHLKRLDGRAKPLLTVFGIHHRWKSSEMF